MKKVKTSIIVSLFVLGIFAVPQRGVASPLLGFPKMKVDIYGGDVLTSNQLKKDGHGIVYVEAGISDSNDFTGFVLLRIPKFLEPVWKISDEKLVAYLDVYTVGWEGLWYTYSHSELQASNFYTDSVGGNWFILGLEASNVPKVLGTEYACLAAISVGVRFTDLAAHDEIEAFVVSHKPASPEDARYEVARDTIMWGIEKELESVFDELVLKQFIPFPWSVILSIPDIIDVIGRVTGEIAQYQRIDISILSGTEWENARSSGTQVKNAPSADIGHTEWTDPSKFSDLQNYFVDISAKASGPRAFKSGDTFTITVNGEMTQKYQEEKIHCRLFLPPALDFASGEDSVKEYSSIYAGGPPPSPFNKDFSVSWSVTAKSNGNLDRNPVNAKVVLMTPIGWTGWPYVSPQAYAPIMITKWISTPIQAGWRFNGHDLARTAYYSLPTSYEIPDISFQTLWSSPHEGKNLMALTGDVNDDGKMEVVKVSGDNLKVIDGEGNGLWTRTISGIDSYYGTGYLSLNMLEDVTGDGVPEIFVSRKSTHTVGHIYVYDGDGNLIKTLTRTVGSDGNMWAVAVFDVDDNGDKEIFCGIGSNYVGNPRGACLFDYNTGSELWYYAAGNPISDCIADLNNDGLMEITSGWWTVHNGAWGQGKGSNTYTSDSSVYVVVINENGDEIFTKEIHGTHNHGGAFEKIVDLNKDGTKEVIVFHGHEPVYPGYAQIFLFDKNGNEFDSYTGSYNKNWAGAAIADINGDGKDEIIVGCNDGVLRVMDYNLNVIDSVNRYYGPQAVNDINGDGKLEIIVTDYNTRELVVLNNNLDELWKLSFPVNPSAIVSDVNGDGANDIIILADQLYVASTPAAFKTPTPIFSPDVEKISLRYSITPEGSWGTGNNAYVQVYDISSRTSSVLMDLGSRPEDVFIVDFYADAFKNRDDNPAIAREEIVQNMYEGVTADALAKLSTYIPKDYALYSDLATVFHLFGDFGKKILEGTQPATTQAFSTLTFLLPVPLEPPTYIYDKYGYQLAGTWTKLSEGFGTGSLITVAVYCLADLQITDSLGRVVNKQINEIPGARYIEADIDGDGELDDAVILPETSDIEYTIEVISDPAASPDDTFTLMAGSSGYGFFLAEDVRMADIPEEGYKVVSLFSPQEETPLLTFECDVQFDPIELSLEPGDTASYDVTVTNLGNIVDTYDVTIEATYEGVYEEEVLSETVTLAAGETTTLSLGISLPYDQGMILGDYYFHANAISQFDSSVSSEAEAVLHVTYTPALPELPKGGLAIAIKPKFIDWESIVDVVWDEDSGVTAIVYEVEILIVNNENYDDVVDLSITTKGFPPQYQADLEWMSWTLLRVFMPAHSNLTIPLTITIQMEYLESEMEYEEPSGVGLFRVLANSETWIKGYAQDYAIISIEWYEPE